MVTLILTQLHSYPLHRVLSISILDMTRRFPLTLNLTKTLHLPLTLTLTRPLHLTLPLTLALPLPCLARPNLTLPRFAWLTPNLPRFARLDLTRSILLCLASFVSPAFSLPLINCLFFIWIPALNAA
jgi:hypothetical protein